MNKLSCFFCSNGKIEHSPLKLKKILCITKAVYAELLGLVVCLKKVPSSDKQLNRRSNHIVQASDSKVLTSYEASEIWSTRESEYWRWIQVKEWYKEYIEPYQSNIKRDIVRHYLNQENGL